jgi:hypothetical protein
MGDEMLTSGVEKVKVGEIVEEGRDVMEVMGW